MITPLIVQFLFWIGAGLMVLSGLIAVGMGLFGHGGFGLVFVGLLQMVIGPVLVRVYCEILILLFRIYDELVLIRKGSSGDSHGFPVTPVSAPPSGI